MHITYRGNFITIKSLIKGPKDLVYYLLSIYLTIGYTVTLFTLFKNHFS